MASSSYVPRVTSLWMLVVLLISVGFCKEDEKDAKTDEKDKATKQKQSVSNGPTDNGPKLYGDPDYWTQLLGLGFSEGTLTPDFSPGHMDYDLNIKSGKSKELLVTPMLNVHKYNLLYKPLLTWNGEVQHYSPIQNIEFRLQLNTSSSNKGSAAGALKKDVTLSVADPKASKTLWGGGGGGHTYKIHVTQAPDIEAIVTAKSIQVMGYTVDNKKVPPKDPDKYDPASPHNEIRYIVGEKASYVTVTVKCDAEATGLKYNGETYSAGSSFTSKEFEGATKSILGQCLYEDDKFTKGQEMQRTYVITVARTAHLEGTMVDLRMWPPSLQGGECVKLDVTEKGSKYHGWKPGWKCLKGGRDAQFVGSYNNSKAELVVVNNRTGGRYRLWNGIPTSIPVPDPPGKDRNADSLILEAGTHKREYTFIFGPPPSCVEFLMKDNRTRANHTTVYNDWRDDKVWPDIDWDCEDRYEVNRETENFYCKWDPCVKADRKTCCVPVRQKCMNYDTVTEGDMKCKGKEVFHPEKLCDWTPCKNTPSDTENCCAAKAKGSAAPCTTMQCGPDLVLAHNALQTTCMSNPCSLADKQNCCEQRMICNNPAMKCPQGWAKKYNAALYLCKGFECKVSDTAQCCTAAAYCDEYTCPAKGTKGAEGTTLGWQKKAASATIACGGSPCSKWDKGVCCNMIGHCATLSCPEGFYLRDNAETIPCGAGTGNFACGEGDVNQCCAPAEMCPTSYSCPIGYSFKLDALSLSCPGPACTDKDRNLCCDMTNPFMAAIDTRIVPVNDGVKCRKLDMGTDWLCDCSKVFGLKKLELKVIYTFDQTVGNNIWIQDMQISGTTASLKLDPIPVTALASKSVHVAVHSRGRVAGRGRVDSKFHIQIIAPPEPKGTPVAVKVTNTKASSSGKSGASASVASKDSGSPPANTVKQTTLRERRRLADQQEASPLRRFLAMLGAKTIVI